MRHARATVLVVDDDEDYATLLGAALTDAGYRTVLARSCEDAVAVLSRSAIDVLLTDLSLVDGTALDLAATLGPDRPQVAIVLSGRDDAYDVARSLAAGYDAHLGKPIAIPTLVAMIERFLARSQSGIRVAPKVSPAKKRPSA